MNGIPSKQIAASGVGSPRPGHRRDRASRPGSARSRDDSILDTRCRLREMRADHKLAQLSDHVIKGSAEALVLANTPPGRTEHFLRQELAPRSSAPALRRPSSFENSHPQSKPTDRSFSGVFKAVATRKNAEILKNKTLMLFEEVEAKILSCQASNGDPSRIDQLRKNITRKIEHATAEQCRGFETKGIPFFKKFVQGAFIVGAGIGLAIFGTAVFWPILAVAVAAAALAAIVHAITIWVGHNLFMAVLRDYAFDDIERELGASEYSFLNLQATHAAMMAESLGIQAAHQTASATFAGRSIAPHAIALPGVDDRHIKAVGQGVFELAKVYVRRSELNDLNRKEKALLGEIFTEIRSRDPHNLMRYRNQDLMDQLRVEIKTETNQRFKDFGRTEIPALKKRCGMAAALGGGAAVAYSGSIVLGTMAGLASLAVLIVFGASILKNRVSNTLFMNDRRTLAFDKIRSHLEG